MSRVFIAPERLLRQWQLLHEQRAFGGSRRRSLLQASRACVVGADCLPPGIPAGTGAGNPMTFAEPAIRRGWTRLRWQGWAGRKGRHVRVLVAGTSVASAVAVAGLVWRSPKGDGVLLERLWSGRHQERPAPAVPPEWAVPEAHPVRWQVCVWRACELLIRAAPIVCTAPVALLASLFSESAADPWWSWATRFFGSNGPTLAKLMQWAASRRDLFPAAFCDRMSELHAAVPVHDWTHSEDALALGLGEHWREQLALESEPIGSGCVAQVYRGRIAGGDAAEVAVKVVHPDVKRLAEVDLELLRGLSSLVDRLLPLSHVIRARACVEEFAPLLLSQMDMRVEAYNLETFLASFHEDRTVSFPTPRPSLCSELVLVESYERGALATAEQEPRTRRRLARQGLQAFLRMLFSHRFVHGDLHPGNVLVSERSGSIVLLDAGLAFRIDPERSRNLRDLFRSVVKGDGRQAGLLLIERSHLDVPQDDADAFCRGVAGIVNDVQERGLQLERLGVADLLSRMMQLCYAHGVRLDPQFASILTSLFVAEGLARLLDPQMDVLGVALPIILSA